jgi:hypothetical protein
MAKPEPIIVDIKVKFSLWDAIKLRIAGPAHRAVAPKRKPKGKS